MTSGQEIPGSQRLRRNHSSAQGNQTQVSIPILLCCPDTINIQCIPQPSWRGGSRTAETKETGALKYHLFFNICFLFFLALPCSMWDLSSQTRNRTDAPLHWKHRSSATGLPEKFLQFPSFLKLSNTPLYGYTAFCLSIHLLMDI